MTLVSQADVQNNLAYCTLYPLFPRIKESKKKYLHQVQNACFSYDNDPRFARWHTRKYNIAMKLHFCHAKQCCYGSSIDALGYWWKLNLQNYFTCDSKRKALMLLWMKVSATNFILTQETAYILVLNILGFGAIVILVLFYERIIAMKCAVTTITTAYWVMNISILQALEIASTRATHSITTMSSRRSRH